jgi:hypothetical protein
MASESDRTPSAATVRFGTSSETMYLSPAEWEGKRVLVHEMLWNEQGPCLGHELEPLTHFDEVVRGELYCPHCCGVASV